MATLNVQAVSLSGISLQLQNADVAGDKFQNDGRTLLRVENGGASAITVTFHGAKECNQGFLHDATVSVPANGDMYIGPFNPSRFNDQQGYVSVSYSSAESVQVAAVRV